MEITTQERWAQLRLVVDRGSSGSAYVSVVVRTVEGRDRRDRRLRTVQLELPPGSLESVSWWHTLVAAVERLQLGEDYV